MGNLNYKKSKGGYMEKFILALIIFFTGCASQSQNYRNYYETGCSEHEFRALEARAQSLERMMARTTGFAVVLYSAELGSTHRQMQDCDLP